MPTSRQRSEFERLALPLQKNLYTAAVYLTQNAVLSEDLAQETYLKAYMAFSSYQPGTHFKAWMMAILRNTYISLCRRKKLEPAELDFTEAAVVNAMPAEPPSALEVLPEYLQKAMGRLSTRHRVMILLADVEGFSYKEISEILACPMGSVMSGLFNAREQLRQFLGEPANKSTPRSVT